MKKLKLFAFSLIAAGLLASCGGGSQKSSESEETKEAPATEAATEEASAEEAVPETVSLTIEGDDMMKFNLKELKVKAGQKVSLTLKHVGKMPKAAMGHNWVLLKPGTDIQAFGMASMNAKDNDYIPQDKADQIIAYTKTLGGGEETTITFDAPAAGYYKFMCSFPGHYATMQGDFIVEP